MTDQRERSPRFRVRKMTAVYDTGDGYWSGPVVDVSATGLFIETAHNLPVGTEVLLMPDLGREDERLPFEIRARVARVRELDLKGELAGHGIALELIGLSDRQRQELNAFLAEHGAKV